jgi:putative hemolysin
LENLTSIFLNNFSPILLAATTQGLVLLGFVIVVLLILSFFVSGAEVAMFSLSYKDINLLKSKQDTGWKRIVNLLEEPRNLLASLLVANSLINIAIIILTNVMIDQVMILRPEFWWAALIIKIIIISTLLILFGEILPKVRATQNNLRFAYEASYVVEIINYLFGRLGARLLSMSDSVEQFVGGKTSAAA